MHWLNILVVFFVLKRTAVSWKGTPYGQVGCDSRFQCLLQSSNSGASKRTQETAPARDINTWYPIPKWKVFFEANKNRNEYSAPYFNKQDPGRTDGNIHDNDFPPMRELAEVFERLNIQFLPLKDGNITVKSFQGKINASGSEYVALFVVYAHSSNMDITGTQNNSDGDTVTMEWEMELMSRKANMSAACDGPGGCLHNVSVVVLSSSLNSSVTERKLFPEGEKVVTIPVTKNMSIEVITGEFDNNNYTIMILPFIKIMNETEVGSGKMTAKHGEIINMTLTKNMSMVIKIGGSFDSKETLRNHSDDGNFTYMNELNTEMIVNEDISSDNVGRNESNNIEGIGDIFNNETVGETISTISDTTENTGSFMNDYIPEMVNATSEIVLVSSTISESTFTTFETEDMKNSSFNDSLDIENIYENRNNSESNKGNELYTTHMNLPASDQSITPNESNRKQNETFQDDGSVNYSKRKPKTGLLPYEATYTKQFGPYEVKEVNSNHSPFIATIHLTINNKVTNNKTGDKEFITTNKVNNSFTDKNNLTNMIFRKTLQRSKRNISNENSNQKLKLYHRIYNVKQKIISDGYFSHENEISNKYSNRTSRMILNKAEETTPAAGTMNHYSLILPGESTKEQSNSSRLFLFSERPDSYSYATISNGNEEFNQKSTDKFRNKGLIANEISDNAVGADGAKSNQTAHGVRNKRELASPTLIPNKGSRENHSVPKKSELQIVEGGSLDKRSDDWKMKIPPGMQYLREDGIKIDKICDLKDGCRGVNDVFNTMTDSGYHKKDGLGRQSFHSNENLESKGRMNKRVEIPDSNFKRKTSDKSVNIERGYKREGEEFEVESKFISPSMKVWFGDSYLKSLQKQVMPIPMIPSQSPYIKINSTNGDIKSKMFGENQYLSKDEKLNKYGNEKISPTLKGKNGILKLREEVKNPFLKKSTSFVNLLRKKRTVSQILPIMDPRSVVYLMDFNTFPTQQMQQFPRGIFSRMRNISLIPPQNERKQQNYILNLQRPPTSEIGIPQYKDFRSNPENRIKEWWFKGGPTWQPRARQSKWLNRNQVNDQGLTRNIMPEYRWVIIVPEITDELRPTPVMRTSTKRPANENMTQPRKIHTNLNREREGEEFINTDWVLIDRVNDPGESRDPNIRMQPIQPASFDIINMPQMNTDSLTTTKPPRKAVSRTTRNPVRKPNPPTTKKSTRNPVPHTTMKPMRPNFQTTSDPWSFDIPWDINGWKSQNPWSVSQNPWIKYATTPMMMGGMAGGD